MKNIVFVEEHMVSNSSEDYPDFDVKKIMIKLDEFKQSVESIQKVTIYIFDSDCSDYYTRYMQDLASEIWSEVQNLGLYTTIRFQTSDKNIDFYDQPGTYVIGIKRSMKFKNQI